jgi:hypothetical protein
LLFVGKTARDGVASSPSPEIRAESSEFSAPAPQYAHLARADEPFKVQDFLLRPSCRLAFEISGYQSAVLAAR